MRPARSVGEPDGTRERLCNCRQYGALRFARDAHKADAIRECLCDCLVAHGWGFSHTPARAADMERNVAKVEG